MRCEIQLHIQNKLEELLDPVFAKHEENEKTIQEYAEQRGIQLETEINLSNVIAEYSKSFPWWIKLLMARQLKKSEGDRQASHRIAFNAYMGQLRWTFFQALFFLLFMLVGAWYANAI